MKPEIIAILSIFIVFSAAEFVRTGFFHKQGQRRKDGFIEAISTMILLVFTQPMVLLGGGMVAAALLPGMWMTVSPITKAIMGTCCSFGTCYLAAPA